MPLDPGAKSVAIGRSVARALSPAGLLARLHK
jgi:hypothetical protein